MVWWEPKLAFPVCLVWHCDGLIQPAGAVKHNFPARHLVSVHNMNDNPENVTHKHYKTKEVTWSTQTAVTSVPLSFTVLTLFDLQSFLLYFLYSVATTALTCNDLHINPHVNCTNWHRAKPNWLTSCFISPKAECCFDCDCSSAPLRESTRSQGALPFSSSQWAVVIVAYRTTSWITGSRINKGPLPSIHHWLTWFALALSQL